MDCRLKLVMASEFTPRKRANPAFPAPAAPATATTPEVPPVEATGSAEADKHGAWTRCTGRGRRCARGTVPVGARTGRADQNRSRVVTKVGEHYQERKVPQLVWGSGSQTCLGYRDKSSTRAYSRKVLVEFECRRKNPWQKAKDGEFEPTGPAAGRICGSRSRCCRTR